MGGGSGGRIIWTTTTGLSTIGHRSLGSVGGVGEGQGAGGGDSVTRAHCPLVGGRNTNNAEIF